MLKFHLISLLVFLFLLGCGAGGFLNIFSTGYLLIYIWLKYKKDESEIQIDPGFVMALGFILVTLSNYNTQLQYNKGTPVLMYEYFVPQYSNAAATIFFIGTLAMLAGYDLLEKKVFPKIFFEMKNPKNFRILFYCSLILSLRKAIPGYSRLPGTIDLLIEFTPTVSILLFARLAFYYNRRTELIYALAITIVQVIIAVLFSYLRNAMVVPIAVFALGAYWGHGNMKVFLKPVFVPFYAWVIIFISLFSAFGGNRQAESRIDNLKNVFVTADGEAEEANTESDIEDRGGFFERTSNIAQITKVVELKSNSKFEHGTTLLILETALIPRFLWPDKPKIALGAWFALSAGLAYQFDDGKINNSVNMTIPGHLWLEFGWIGLIGLSFVLGMFIKAIWNASDTKETPYNLGGMVVACYLLRSAFFGLGADLQIFISILATFLMFFVIFKVLYFFFPNS